MEFGAQLTISPCPWMANFAFLTTGGGDAKTLKSVADFAVVYLPPEFPRCAEKCFEKPTRMRKLQGEKL